MTEERFEQLLSGPLFHPLPIVCMLRLACALQSVVEATGEDGEKALEDHCRLREIIDTEDEDA